MGYNFDVIKAQFELRGEVQRILGQPIKQTRTHDMYPCPFHDEKTPGAFQVYDEKYKCWSCGAYGDVLDFISWAENKELSDLLRENKISMSPEEIRNRQAEIVENREAAREREQHLLEVAREKLQATERWIEYHENLNQYYRQLWRGRGIADHWQNYFQLGATDDFIYKTNTCTAHSKTLTIPVKAIGGKVLTIRHRLLNPIDGQRYRPDVAGLGAHPFICDIDNPRSDEIIITEGEIKSIVAYTTLDKPGWQCVGVPSKSMMIDNVLKLKGRKNVIVIPDPDGADEIMPAAKAAGAKIFVPPTKVDDWIIENEITKNEFSAILSQARRA